MGEIQIIVELAKMELERGIEPVQAVKNAQVQFDIAKGHAERYDFKGFVKSIRKYTPHRIRNSEIPKINKLSKKLLLDGFDYSELEKYILENIELRHEEELELCVDYLLERIEANASYVHVVNVKNKKEYCYNTVTEMSKNTGLSIGTINGSIYGYHLANGMFEINKYEYSASEICKNKHDMFKDKIGKVNVKERYTKTGKHISSPVKVTDVISGEEVVYSTGREFCEKYNMKNHNLSKYINCGYRLKRRYLIEKVV